MAGPVFGQVTGLRGLSRSSQPLPLVSSATSETLQDGLMLQQQHCLRQYFPGVRRAAVSAECRPLHGTPSEMILLLSVSSGFRRELHSNTEPMV